MSFEHEKQEAGRLLLGLEEGGMSTADAYDIAENRDPLLVYFIFRYLREKYPPGGAQSQGIVERLLDLASTYDGLMKATKEAEKDPMREWFDDTHSMNEFFDDSQEFVDMIVEKLEG
jgi:hypothetical protein